MCNSRKPSRTISSASRSCTHHRSSRRTTRPSAARAARLGQHHCGVRHRRRPDRGQYRDAFVVNVYPLQTEITPDKLPDAKAELENSVIPQLEASTQDMKISEITETTVAGKPAFTADAVHRRGRGSRRRCTSCLTDRRSIRSSRRPPTRTGTNYSRRSQPCSTRCRSPGPQRPQRRGITVPARPEVGPPDPRPVVTGLASSYPEAPCRPSPRSPAPPAGTSGSCAARRSDSGPARCCSSPVPSCSSSVLRHCRPTSRTRSARASSPRPRPSRCGRRSSTSPQVRRIRAMVTDPDVASAWIQFIGTLLFNVMTLRAVFLPDCGRLRHDLDPGRLRFGAVPDLQLDRVAPDRPRSASSAHPVELPRHQLDEHDRVLLRRVRVGAKMLPNNQLQSQDWSDFGTALGALGSSSPPCSPGRTERRLMAPDRPRNEQNRPGRTGPETPWAVRPPWAAGCGHRS